MNIKFFESLFFVLILKLVVVNQANAFDTDTLRVSQLLLKVADLRQKNPDSAMVYADEAYQLAESLNDEEWIGRSLYLKGILQFVGGNYPESLSSYQRSLDLFTKNKLEKRIPQLLANIGMIYSRTGDYENAVNYDLQALKMAEALNNRELQGKIYNSLGIISKQQSNYKEAIQYYNKAFSLFKAMNNQLEVAGTYTNLSNVYIKSGRLDSSILINKKALSIFDSLGNQRGKVTCYNNLAEAYRLLNDYPSALTYLTMSIKVSSSQKVLRSNYLIAQTELGNLQVAMGNLPEAERNLKSAIAGIEKKELALLAIAYQNLAKCYDKMGRHKESYEALKRTLTLNDSIFNNEMTSATANAQARYELDNKETEIEVLKAENRAKQSYLIGSIVIAILIFAIVILSVNYVHLRLRKKNEMAELRALRAQMNPHFIFNSLNSINLFIVKADPETASSYLTRFSKLMRIVLENSKSEYVSLEQELAVLKLYIELELLRFDNQFNHQIDYQIDVDESIDSSRLTIPPLLLQPYVENAIWHGLRKKNGHGLLRIKIEREKDSIVCIVDDNGIGREATNGKKARKSFGMSITAARIEALNSERKVKSSEIVDKKDEEGKSLGTLVKIWLPEVYYEAAAV